ncbi:type III pantothenate kinase [Jannaschia sp. CCS1]|uniref:Type III pantothenate kinase n=1 Tax=Jannaschia sp. (strain CCS1) TaxID=290400 RepID=COAX_JANSC|nr:type III pantothenate kinase [Jannaschia sp. CCS1]Q28T47.1 RecName: Full=Type III pantothenate kinase; AltName: Full=PanK-III; AltName: Full=Pantothenic acid kinase [Jannaschia sp. CCS1]ABD54115.1 pantothenate kinase [Jannaschia sp. CCS1]
MLLCIDCGNTNTVFSIWDGESWLCTMRTSTHHSRTADAYFTWFSTLLGHYGIDPQIDDVIISSTVPRVVFNLRVFCDRFFNLRPLVVGKPDCALPMEPRVDFGTGVGPDRLANAVGAFARHGGDCVVVDFGTATNFDVVAEDGAYVGGVIAPGVNLSLEALALGAAALPHVDITKPDAVIGTNTVACIQSGVFWGYVGLIEGITTRIKAEYGKPMKVIGTGGLAPLFAQGEVLFDTVEDDLTMYGLTVIHKYNKDKNPS